MKSPAADASTAMMTLPSTRSQARLRFRCPSSAIMPCRPTCLCYLLLMSVISRKGVASEGVIVQTLSCVEASHQVVHDADTKGERSNGD
eukprot:scaffold5134_cov38-Prasinocladus_malaysianus.AAC.1